LIADGKLTQFQINPQEYGFQLCSLEELRGGSPVENARITLEILNGQVGPKRDIVLLNAATALLAAGRVKDIHEGVALARESLDSGQALSKLLVLTQQSAQKAEVS